MVGSIVCVLPLATHPLSPLKQNSTPFPSLHSVRGLHSNVGAEEVVGTKVGATVGEALLGAGERVVGTGVGVPVGVGVGSRVSGHGPHTPPASNPG